MKKQYDFVYLTNTPSFYKLNLCNEIAKTNSVLIVFYGYGSEAVNETLKEKGDYRFDFYFLNGGDSNKRNKWKTFAKLVLLMIRLQCKKVIFAGWFAPEYNTYSLLSPKRKNVVVCESSILDVKFQGVAGMIKKTIINRMGTALPSGLPHAELFKSIEFKGEIHITGSVGIFYKPERLISEIKYPLKYLYVGRLIDVKGLNLLVDVFNQNGKPLTIVGVGNKEMELKAKAKSNISFTGFVDNKKLGEIYQAHNVFILPSKYEPWGLVVEEAIYWGLPVIVSDKVGSSIDMVKNLNTGCVFKSGEMEGLALAIEDMERNMQKYKANVKKVDWDLRDKIQVEAYSSLIKT